MVKTRKKGKTEEQAKTCAKVKPTVKPKKIIPSEQVKELVEEIAYERLLRRVKENKTRKSTQQSKPARTVSATDKNLTSKKKRQVHEDGQESDVLPESSEYIQGNNVAANFVEDEMKMEIGVGDVEREFPMESDPETNLQGHDNNATVAVERVQIGASGSRPSLMTTRPVLIDANPVTRASGEEGMHDTLKMMQDYMLKKGLIMPDMNDQQLREFLHKESNSTDQGTENETNSAQVMKSKVTNKRMPAQQPIGRDNLSSSASETTIYRRL